MLDRIPGIATITSGGSTMMHDLLLYLSLEGLLLFFGFYTRDDSDDVDRNENIERDHKQVISFMYSDARSSIFGHLSFYYLYSKIADVYIYIGLFNVYLSFIYTHLLTCLLALDAYFAGG